MTRFDVKPANLVWHLTVRTFVPCPSRSPSLTRRASVAHCHRCKALRKTTRCSGLAQCGLVDETVVIAHHLTSESRPAIDGAQHLLHLHTASSAQVSLLLAPCGLASASFFRSRSVSPSSARVETSKTHVHMTAEACSSFGQGT